MLTHKDLIRQLDYDHLTGIFIRKVSNSNRTKVGDIAGTKHNGYIIIQVNGYKYRAHRLAWLHYYGYMPENRIDHKDRVKHHNWIKNLREASHMCNIRNTGNYKSNKSGVKGVYWHQSENKWAVQITVNQKTKHLGIYKNFDDAVCARLAGEQCLDWEGCDSYEYVREIIL